MKKSIPATRGYEHSFEQFQGSALRNDTKQSNRVSSIRGSVRSFGRGRSLAGSNHTQAFDDELFEDTVEPVLSPYLTVIQENLSPFHHKLRILI